MKLTDRAKKKWFYKNINSYYICFYDSIYNVKLVSYIFGGLFNKECVLSFYGSEVQSFLRYIQNMKDWEIFFKFRKFLRYDQNKINTFRMGYNKYDKKIFD